jgi:hypothetical protein
MPSIIIGKQNNEKYQLTSEVQAIATQGTEISWWVLSEASSENSEICCRGLYGQLTTLSGMSYHLSGLQINNHPPILQREIALVRNEVSWWNCRESCWVDKEPEPISVNELRAICDFGKNNTKFDEDHIVWTFHPNNAISEFFRNNPSSTWYSGQEGVYIKTFELESKKPTFWSYRKPWKHSKKRLDPILGFSPGKQGSPLDLHDYEKQLA